MIVKTKPKFFFLSVKRNILPLCFCLFTLFLIIFSKSNLSAAKSGLSLWANNVVPSLLPFFIATELLSYTSVVHKVGKWFEPFMKPIFHVPGCGAYAFLMGIISGYPTGAKIVTNFRKEGLCTKEEGERLVCFTNNSGPLFIIGTVGVSLFGNTLIGFLLFITHILASITTGFLFRSWKYRKTSNSKTFSKISSKNTSHEFATFSNLGEVLSKSIISSIQTVVMIGGFVVLFSVILSILENSKLLNLGSYFISPVFSIFGIDSSALAKAFLAGFIELTNGVKQISAIQIKDIRSEERRVGKECRV